MNSFQNPTNEIIRDNNSTVAAYQRKSKKYMEAAKAPNTVKAYQTDWKDFTNWCKENNKIPLPADPIDVSDYLADLADSGKKTSTIQRRIASISQAHQMKGYPTPTKTAIVHTTWQGIRNELGTAPKQKRAADIEIIKAICRTIPDTLNGHRNRALLLVGFAFGSRRSELISLNVEDIIYNHKGMELFIRKSKTDQEGKGRKPVIFYGQYPETCPVRSLQKWLKEGNVTSGAIFRKVDRHGNVGDRLTADGFRYIFEKLIEKAGFYKSDFSPHSLRHGFITTAHIAGKDEHSIMRQTGHKSVQTMRRYIDDADRFVNNATDGIGL